MGNFSTQTPKNIPICLGTTRWENFGVVVSLEYRHPTVLSGMLLYPLGEAKTVLRRLNDFISPMN